MCILYAIKLFKFSNQISVLCECESVFVPYISHCCLAAKIQFLKNCATPRSCIVFLLQSHFACGILYVYFVFQLSQETWNLLCFDYK